MATIRKTENGIEYLFGLLKQKAKTITRVAFWKIPHKTQQGDICLKIGRYNKNSFAPDTLEIENPKSELTLDNDEFKNLLEFLAGKLQCNMFPFVKNTGVFLKNSSNPIY